MHIETLLRHIQVYSAYSAPCVTLSYWQPGHILSPGIFSTRDLFNTLRNVDQTYSEPYHRALLTLAYAETWHSHNHGIFRTLR